MKRSKKGNSVAGATAELEAQLRSFPVSSADLDLRTKVLQLVGINKASRELFKAVLREGGITARSARERIRLYLLRHPMTPIVSEELLVVSGITDFQRRIRELRVELGYPIVTGAKCHESLREDFGLVLATNEYLLLSTEPDVDAARRWKTANRIRRDNTIGARDKVLAYLKANVGEVVSTEILQYVANDAAEFGRRIRELRTEQGYSIATCYTGRPDLRPGQYVLETLERVAEPHDRRIPIEIQRQVYDRDNQRCRACGWSFQSKRPGDSRILELHHVEMHSKGGTNTIENLVVLCSRCHDAVHAGTLAFDPKS